MLDRLIEVICPSRCKVCADNAHASTSYILCSQCAEHLDKKLSLELSAKRCGIPTCHRCGEPSLESTHGIGTCVTCSVWPLPLAQLRSLGAYEGVIEHAICAMKYSGARKLTTYFAHALSRALQTPGMYFSYDKAALARDTWDLLVPVPSSTASLRHRGFGHMAFIARETARLCKLKQSSLALSNRHIGPTQVEVDFKDRHSNVLGAFVAKDKAVSGKRVLLIDDVITTGSTLAAASAALYEAGATSVDAITIARSRRFASQRAYPGLESHSPRSHVFSHA